LGELVERGIQPDVLALSGSSVEAVALIERGALVLEIKSNSGLSGVDISWTAEASPARWLPKVDLLAAEMLPVGDERRRWLKFAPRYLGRSMSARRYLRMAGAEAERFAKSVEEAVVSGAIGTKITIQSAQAAIIPEQRR
jgi:hypothetical protein